MPAPVTERRRSARTRTFIGGKVIFNQRQSTLDCTVRNLSDDGALLVFPDSVTLPDLFELYFPLKRESRMARSRWRDGDRIGVAFAAPAKQDAEPVQLDLMRRLRQLEQENAALKARIVELTEGA
ncbi:PilZ domain-containing protein [Bosea sp. CS1GBMeth4]|uniref:PilZ domain-containing protein n=1 Tax=Bosea sp. CS1GBMeth4 TaxID=1892849 RepID=UPI001648560D|nr:PilZ domain-containing protein [Bosea sp. CS1GBMeth4]